MMLVIYAVIYFALHNLAYTKYSLHYSDIRQGSYLTFDCLYAQFIEGEINEYSSYVVNNQLIPFCRRPEHDEKEEERFSTLDDNVLKKINFKQLREQGVKSEQLLSWSAPIDLVERYEMNTQSSELFYNCSSSWFGSKCQYQFVYDSSLSFNAVVQASVDNREDVSINASTTTCYKFLSDCHRGPWSLCLDWRQICNGKADCMNGADEQWCDMLEMSTCADDEYRCHYGGQCIPRIFARDSRLSTDCLDGSEEVERKSLFQNTRNDLCGKTLTFRCEERINRYPFSFPCGNGQFLQAVDMPSNGKRCSNRRNREVTLTMLTSFDHIHDIKCREAFRCLLLTNRSYDFNVASDVIRSHEYFKVTWDTNCESLAEYCSNESIVLPEYPVLYGYFQFVYLTNRSIEEFKINAVPDFICFDAKKCPGLLSKILSIQIIDGLTCFRASDLLGDNKLQHFDTINSDFKPIYDMCSTAGNETSCLNSSYFHCHESSKCISYNRVGDGFPDCFNEEDELFSACHLNISNRFTCPSDRSICLSLVAVGNTFYECPKREDEKIEYIYGIIERMPLSYICDDFLYMIEEEGNETDETNCDWWPCGNIYLHCNNYWDCFNGIDELNCPNTNCSLNEFECKNQYSNTDYCLPLVQMYYKRQDDCFEDNVIRKLYFANGTYSIGNDYFSFNKSECISQDDICNNHSKSTKRHEDTCIKISPLNIQIIADSVVYLIDKETRYLCTLQLKSDRVHSLSNRFFHAPQLGYFPSTISNNSVRNLLKNNQQKNNIPKINATLAWYCHYGVLTLFKGINKTKACLCPPNYFGSQCQWQSQRVSLTLQFKMKAIISSTVIFQFIIMLVDEQGQVAPNYEQITYMPAHECFTKFNIYILYPHRPKNTTSNYSIRIDLYDKATSEYWTRWHLPIPFQFLPVNRIATQLIIPEVRQNQICDLPCGKHGKCMKYENINNSFYCRCDQGYFGLVCDIKYQCQCSNDSLCLAPFICVCPLNKFGSRCFVNRSICQPKNNPCKNHGLCIATDDRINLYGFLCVCKEGYQGEQCEYKSNQIDIRIDEAIIPINSTLIIHYITAFDGIKSHERTTMFKKIPFDQNSISIYVAQPFNIIFIQIPDGAYYLAVLREKFIPSEYIHTQISVKQYCPSVNNLFNDTLRQYIYLRQVKYYPLLCRQYSELMCFYDEYNMCICDSNRFSSCFEFNYTLKHDCDRRYRCHNDGKCMMNNATCPTKFICLCSDCYYGAQCQFSTKGFLLSLDAIIGYHIKPNVALHRQPFIVKLSIAITTIMLVSELILGSLSIVTFQLPKLRQVGCGYYLLVSSFTSICTIIVLTIKFWYLILSQMSVVTNRSFVFVNCVSIEIILKACLATTEWLYACVAIDRMFAVVQGAFFNKNKSKTIAKWMIWVVIILCIVTHIHDPINRELINDLDGDQERIWCFSDYSLIETQYNTFITLFHFLTPFTINIISALVVVIVTALGRFKIDSKITLVQHFLIKLKQHKHIMFAAGTLLLFGLPRLIISFSSGCMRSPRQPWLFLIGYFVSFLPVMMTLFIFILPSSSYKEELIRRIRGWIQRLHKRS